MDGTGRFAGRCSETETTLAQAPSRHVQLINPPYEQIGPGHEHIRHLTSRTPSLGLLHLAAELREHGYRPAILEGDLLNLSREEAARRVIEARPAFVGITLFTVGVASAAEIAQRIKSALPETRIIVGGPHISSMGRETLQRIGAFDVAVVGEGERTLIQLLGTMESGGDLSAVPGIIFRRDGALVSTPLPATSTVLDELALPAWGLLPGFPRCCAMAVFDYPRGPIATLSASRGCPFHCRFCDNSTFGTRVRFYSPARVFEMIRQLSTRWGVRHIQFVDDHFLSSRQRATELCELLIQSGMKLTWSCDSRVDVITPDLVSLMKKAGCWQICFGLESGSEEMLAKMGKKASAAQGEQAARWTHEAGIRVKGLFMLGFPGETAGTVEMTKQFIARLPMDILNLSKFTPYPGSQVYRDIYGQTIRDDHWDQMNGMNFLWAPEGMTIQQLDGHYRDLTSSFYRQKRVGRAFMRAGLANPEHFRRLLQAGMGFLMGKLRLRRKRSARHGG